MSNNDRINFRSTPPNQEIPRPLSTYDNLNMNATTDLKSNLTETESNGTTMEHKNVNEFPFSGISFRFDELKQLQKNNASLQPQPQPPPSTLHSNGYDNIESTNYPSNVNNNNINNNNNNNISNNPNINQYNNINGGNQIRSNQGHTVTTIAQNHSSASSSSSSGSTSSSVDGYRSPTVNYDERSINNKPVHSAAKSQFFGLHKSGESNGNNSGETIKRLQDERENAGESSTVSDEEPLLNHYSNKIFAINSNPSTSQYQNVPVNNVYFDQNRIRNVCTCKDGDAGAEIQQYEYKCKNCLISNSVNESTIGVPNPMANIDLASCSTSMKPTKQITLDASSSFRISQSLSQAVYMSTTVPQNIKGSNIMGSHLPTRNSLRHSRMLVGKKNFQAVRRRNPLNVRHPTTVKFVFYFHILVGLVVSCLGLWLCWWAPSTRARENPYWSGLVLMLSGILGLIVLAFKPMPRQKLRQHFITFLRINSTFVTFMASICTLLASSFAIMHLINLFSPTTECRPVNMLVDSSSCTCSFVEIPKNETINSLPKTDGEILSGSYYRDLNCNEVMGPFTYILVASSISNAIGLLLCCTLLVMLCLRQKPVKRVPYSSANSRHRL